MWTKKSTFLVLLGLATTDANLNLTNATGTWLDVGLSLDSQAPASLSFMFNTRGIPYPDYRYQTWSSLDAHAKADAEFLGYTQATWNHPGEADIEMLRYETIEFDSLETAVLRLQQWNDTAISAVPANKTKLEALFALGFEDWEVYDCYINHYTDYWWFDMNEATRAAFETLGWSEGRWNHSAPHPESEDKDWYELTADEQGAAAELCYLPETWAMLSLEYWPIDYALLVNNGIVLENMANDSNTELFPPADNLALQKPVNRFYEWDVLPEDIVKMVTNLGYTQETWAEVLQAPIEKTRYDALDANQREAVQELGFGPKEVYDCWIHHYDSFKWDDLATAGVQTYVGELGWTPSSWQGIIAPPVRLPFDSLTGEQQGAALQLCYTQEMWDNENFLVLPDMDVESTLAPAKAKKLTIVSVTNVVDYPDMDQSITVDQTEDDVAISSPTVIADTAVTAETANERTGTAIEDTDEITSNAISFRLAFAWKWEILLIVAIMMLA